MKVSNETIETKAKDLHEKGLERWQIIVELAKVFPAKAINDWLDSKVPRRGRR